MRIKPKIVDSRPVQRHFRPKPTLGLVYELVLPVVDPHGAELTPELRGRLGRRKGNQYVIQKHAARELHYDLRLEMSMAAILARSITALARAQIQKTLI